MASACWLRVYRSPFTYVVALALLIWIPVQVLAAPPPDPDEIVFKVRQKGFKPGPRVSPDGKIGLRVKGLTAQLYRRSTGKPIGPVLKHLDRRPDTRITCWAFSPDGKRVATGAGDPNGKINGDSAGEVIVWDIATGQEVSTISDRNADVGYVNAIAFKDNQTVLIDCDEISGK
jgi:hypothetical protein